MRRRRAPSRQDYLVVFLGCLDKSWGGLRLRVEGRGILAAQVWERGLREATQIRAELARGKNLADRAQACLRLDSRAQNAGRPVKKPKERTLSPQKAKPIN